MSLKPLIVFGTDEAPVLTICEQAGIHVQQLGRGVVSQGIQNFLHVLSHHHVGAASWGFEYWKHQLLLVREIEVQELAD